MRALTGAIFALLALLSTTLSAQPARPAGTTATPTASQLPAELEGVGFEQNLGAELPLDARFRDEKGAQIALGDYFEDGPVLLALVYYECPMLCTLVMDGVSTALKAVDFTPGEDFDIVMVSIDPGETPAMAAEAKEKALARYGDEATAGGWHFLTGDEAEIARLAEAVGFSYRYDEATDLYNHAGGIVLATADGRAARYFYGVEYPPRDLRLGLVEASDNRIASPIDHVLLFCFRYDPATGQYSTAVLNLVRAGGILTLLALALFIGRMVRRDRRLAAQSRSNPGMA